MRQVTKVDFGMILMLHVYSHRFLHLILNDSNESLNQVNLISLFRERNLLTSKFLPTLKLSSVNLLNHYLLHQKNDLFRLLMHNFAQ